MDFPKYVLSESLVEDGNAAAGILNEIFASEMTASPTQCAGCGREGELATLEAYLDGPGIVLRCPGCQSAVLRIVRTPEAIYLDARGAAYLRIARGPFVS
jgi:DNA-directed RNA polymerase subunit RPC12/RpoP